MTIKCNLCPWEVSDLDIDQKKALQVVCEKLAHHVIKSHKKEHAEIYGRCTKSAALLVWYVLVTQLGRIPEGDTFMEGEAKKALDFVMDTLGFDIEKGGGDEKDKEIRENKETVRSE